MGHGIVKKIIVVLVMISLPVILLSFLFSGVLFGAFMSGLSR